MGRDSTTKPTFRRVRLQLLKLLRPRRVAQLIPYTSAPSSPAAVYLVQRLHHVGQVHPRRPLWGHLVEEVVPEELEQVTVARFSPVGVLVEPAHTEQG